MKEVKHIYKLEFSNEKIQLRSFEVVTESQKCYKIRCVPERRVPKSGLNIVSCSASEYPMWAVDNSQETIDEYRQKLVNAIEHTKMLYEYKLANINAAFNRVMTAKVNMDDEKLIRFTALDDGTFNKEYCVITRRTPSTVDICAELNDIFGNVTGEEAYPISKIGKISTDDNRIFKKYIWNVSDKQIHKEWEDFKQMVCSLRKMSTQ